MPKKNHTVAASTDPVYDLVRELIEQHHPDLAEAKLIVVWRENWKPDKDGHLKLGQLKKASDYDASLKSHQFALLLNADAWQHFDEQQHKCLVDHFLMYGVGEMSKDDRRIYRKRKPDVVEFTPIVERYGPYTLALRELAEAAAKKKRGQPGLFDDALANLNADGEEGGDTDDEPATVPMASAARRNGSHPAVEPWTDWETRNIAELPGISKATAENLTAAGLELLGAIAEKLDAGETLGLKRPALAKLRAALDAVRGQPEPAAAGDGTSGE